MKLLIFLSSMSSGGAERVAATMSNYWIARDMDITIVTMDSKAHDFYPLDSRIKRIDLNLSEDSPNALVGLYKNLGRIQALRKVLKNVNPDVAWALLTNNNSILALASIGLGLKTIGSERNYPPFFSIGIFWNTLRKFTYGLLTKVTAMTSEGQAWIETHTYAKRVTTIHNPAIWPLPPNEPYLKPIESPRFKLLAVGRLVVNKGFDYLIDAFAKLAEKHPDWDLIILGEGHLRKMLEDQVSQHGLNNRILLPGRAGNVGDWYQSADLFVLSSRVEGFPNSLVEAMAYGLPVVSFDCNTGPRDMIVHEVNGVLVRPDDVEALSVSLNQLMADEKLRKEYASQATKVREKFSLEKIASEWEALFKEI